MRWTAWGLVFACGCGRIGLDAARASDATSSGDAPGASDALPPTCASLSPSDDFAPGGAACGSWGAPSQRGFSMTRSASGLLITPTSFMSNTDFGGCTVSNYDENQGTFVEVLSVLTATGYTNLTAYVTDSSTFGMQVDAGQLHLTTGPTSVAYDPVAMRFWRITSSGTDLVAQYSADAQTWSELARMNFGTSDFSSIANVTFGAGRSDATGSGTATFAAFNRCH